MTMSEKSPYSTGIMVCLYPVEASTPWSKEIPPHLTLIYSGKVTDEAPPSMDDLLTVTQQLAMAHGVQRMDVKGLGNLGESGEANVVLMQPKIAVQQMRDALVDFNRSQHKTFKPHVTIDNDGEDGGMDEAPDSIVFNRIALHYGEDEFVFPLSGGVGKAAKVYSSRYRAKQKLYRRKIKAARIKNPMLVTPEQVNPLMVSKFVLTRTHPRKCKYCDAPCTKGVIWAEGMARIPVCDKHVQEGIRTVGRSEVIAVKPIEKSDSAMREAMRKGAVGQMVRGGSIIARSMTPGERSARSKKAWLSRDHGNGGKPRSVNHRTGVIKPVTTKPQRAVPKKPSKPGLKRLMAERKKLRNKYMADLDRFRVAREAEDKRQRDANGGGGRLFRAALTGAVALSNTKTGRAVSALHQQQQGAKRAAERRAKARRELMRFVMDGPADKKKLHGKVNTSSLKKPPKKSPKTGPGSAHTVPELDAVSHTPEEMAHLDERERETTARAKRKKTTPAGLTPEKQARLDQLQRERLARAEELRAKAAASEKPVKKPAAKKAETKAEEEPVVKPKKPKPKMDAPRIQTAEELRLARVERLRRSKK